MDDKSFARYAVMARAAMSAEQALGFLRGELDKMEAEIIAKFGAFDPSDSPKVDNNPLLVLNLELRAVRKLRGRIETAVKQGEEANRELRKAEIGD